MLVFYADGTMNSTFSDSHSIGFGPPEQDFEENLASVENGVYINSENGKVTIRARRARDTGDVEQDFLIPLD